jgi:transcriptional regulator with XRE-family HTH domain
MISVYTERYQKLLERLLEARRESGLTQVDVAQAFGKPQSFVSKCESGERRIDVVELGAFANLYRKPLTYFVAEVDLPAGASLSLDRAVQEEPPPPSASSPRKGAAKRPATRRR